jgi:putative transposase
MGYLLVVVVHAANIYDGRAAREVLSRLFSLMNTVKKIWADGTYLGEELAHWVHVEFQCMLEIVNKKKTGKGFQILPRRWVVERTFAWLGRSRRLSKDYERNPHSSASLVYVASSRLMLRRLCEKTATVEEMVEASSELALELV